MGITDDDLQLQADFDVLDQAIVAVRNGADLTAKRAEEKKARPLLNQLKSACNKFRNAVQRLEDPTQRSVFNRKYSAYDEKIKGYDKELRNLITAPKSVKKEDVKVSYEEKKKEEIMAEGGKQGLGFENATQVLGAANRAQDDINKSLMRSLRLGVTTRDQTQEIIGELAKQTEKLYAINKDLAVLDTDLERGKKEVMKMWRILAGDKICLGCTALLLLGCCGLIFYKMFADRGGFQKLEAVASNLLNRTAAPSAAPTPVPPTTTTGFLIGGLG